MQLYSRVKSGSVNRTVQESTSVSLSVSFQAAVWQALNHYAYLDAVFLAERLYAEGNTCLSVSLPVCLSVRSEEAVYLLATC